MQTSLSESDIEVLLQKLRQELQTLKGAGCLEFAFESAAKHIPVYLKIVKGHIDQLANVLELETHNHRNLDTAELAEPVIQLTQLFRELNDEDVQLLEALASESRNWSMEPVDHYIEDPQESTVSSEA